MDKRKETPSQTAGPYLHIGLAPRTAGFEMFDADPGGEIAPDGVAGERIRIEGRVIDGAGAPVTDVLIEVWQADAAGIYPGTGAEPDFNGWGRVVPNPKTGIFGFDTIKPGPVPGRGNAMQAPHLTLWLVARGINLGLWTRLYFSDEAQANAVDPVLALIDDPARRETLMALRGSDAPVYCFDIHLQGDSETVFFDA